MHPRHERSQRVQTGHSPLPNYAQKRISKQQHASAPRTLTARPNRSLAVAQLRTETNIQAATCIRATNAHSASKRARRAEAAEAPPLREPTPSSGDVGLGPLLMTYIHGPTGAPRP
ncbi:hypothetical protein MRX96_016698 [Rhipicephalus microplus]